MPIYTYKDESGNVVERSVPIADRDKQEGLTRIIKFTGSVWAPTSGGFR